jgi:hypothetical protein
MLALLLKAVVRFIAGGGLGAVADKLADAYKAKQAAATDSERIEADARIRALEAQRDVLVSESAGGGLQALIRPLFALPFVIYNFKLVVWDKVLGWGATDPLSAELFRIEMLVIGAYFLGRSAEKVVRIAKR